MTSPISPISGFAGVGGVEAVKGLKGLTGTDETTATEGPNADFTSLLAKGLESVQASQAKADDLAVKVADGTLADPAQYTMAANEAALGFQLTLAVRNKAVEAFQEIMRMQA
jgi:flagellar hook-basal body complex protein FliE